MSSSPATGQHVRGGNRTKQGGQLDRAASDNPKKPSYNLKIPIPSDWQPSPTLIVFASERGFTDHEAKFMGQQMVNHFEATSERRAGWGRDFQKLGEPHQPKAGEGARGAMASAGLRRGAPNWRIRVQILLAPCQASGWRQTSRAIAARQSIFSASQEPTHEHGRHHSIEGTRTALG